MESTVNDTAQLATALAEERDARPKLLSIVAPAYNEEDVLELFEKRVSELMQRLEQNYELVLVNDGSTDSTINVMFRLRSINPNITIINLTRNFGKEIALSAGLDHSSGDVIIVIDTDLQDPPELIEEMLEKWHAGYDVVYAQRTVREGESWIKKATASGFYWLMQKIGPVEVPRDTGDFRLMTRRVVDSVKLCKERHRFMKGIFAWVGYPQTAILYRRHGRAAGTTKWNYWRLWNLSLEGITSFTTLPLRITTYFGLVVAVLAISYGLWIVLKTLMFGEEIQGFPTLITAILFLGGVQLVALGVIGEYLGRIFNETKNRPLYLVERVERAQSVEQLPLK